MTELILHHFDLSPYAEKIRKLFGIKGLEWRSVDIPMIMPKPALMPLTGGYRKTPVLQIGADVYCDTALIVEVLEERHATPDLFASGRLANRGVQTWCDVTLFPAAAALSLHENAANLPAPLIADRRAYFSFLDFDALATDAPHYRAQFRAGMMTLNAQMGDGRDFIFGNAPEWADINAHFIIWTAQGNIPSAAAQLDTLPALRVWYARMEAFGTGNRTELDPTEALNIARQATPAALEPSMPNDQSGLQSGAFVHVSPTDHGRVPVSGRLVSVTDGRISILRETDKLGQIMVHFPRTGFRIDAVKGV